VSRVHIVGAGMAGLAAAVRLARAGRPVVLYESSGHAGGRCRSFHDSVLDCTIDNGNHLLLSGNRSALSFLNEIGARDSLSGPDKAAFPFFDVASGERWTVRLNTGPIPWWVFRPSCRPPGTGAADFLSILKLARAAPGATVGALFGGSGAFFNRFLEPLAIAALNTPLERAAAAPLWQVFRETFARGGAACRPLMARDGLSASFVAPALAFLQTRGVPIRCNTRLKQVATETKRAVRLEFADEAVELSAADRVLLALPPAGLTAVLPGIPVPLDSHAIVNIHFKLDRPADALNESPILGVLGGVAEWLFLRGDVVSVTVSAADGLVDRAASDIAALVWDDVAQALDLSGEMPLYRVVKERRATFSQTPAAMRLRPATRTVFENLFLAGDWIDTGLPATIESAVRSGHDAAGAVLAGP
jgi:squalene-associated FAD-dependent desaturase